MTTPDVPKSSVVRTYRAPLVGVAIALMPGILAGRYGPVPVGFWALASLTAVVVAGITFIRPHLHLATCAAICVAIFSIGAMRARMAWERIPTHHIVTYTDDRPIMATVRGRVATSPQIVAADENTVGYRRPPQTVFIIKTASVLTHRPGGSAEQNPHWAPSDGLMRVTVEQPERGLAGGQLVELVGWMGRYRPPDNPGQFDWYTAGRRNGTLTWMSVPTVEGVTLLDAGRPAPAGQALWNVRTAVRQHLQSLGDRRDGRLVNALVIGQRHPSLKRLNLTMMRAGVAHLLSISGMHLGIFLGFVYLLCRLVSLTPRRSALAVLAVLAAYLLLAEPRAPLLRSAMMAAALCLAAVFRRRYMALNALAAAAVVLLLLDPLELISAGFQLSFSIVAGIILLTRPATNLLFGRWLRRRGLMVFRREQRLQRWIYYRGADWTIRGIAMCLVAYVMAAPLVAVHFGLFSPYAPLLSILMLPLVAAVLIPGYVSAALAWPLPNLSRAIGELSAGAADALAWIVRQLDALPALSLELRPVGAWVAILFYAALLLAALQRRIRHGAAFAAAIGVVAVTAIALSQRPADAPAVAELHVLSVGGGQCALLHTPAGSTYLIDAGSRGGFDVYRSVLRPFLLERRLPAPRVAFISHANTDHYGAIGPLLDHVPLRRVYLNAFFGRAKGDSPPPEGPLMRRLAGDDVEVVRLCAGRRISLDERTSVEVLWPVAAPPDDLTVNDTSLVLRITCDGRSVLLPGDLDSTGQAALIASGSLEADALVLPHHGGWEPTLPEFFDATDPKVILVSASRRLRAPASGGKRARAFYNELAKRRCYTTPEHGWICLRFGQGGLNVETMR